MQRCFFGNSRLSVNIDQINQNCIFNDFCTFPVADYDKFGFLWKIILVNRQCLCKNYAYTYVIIYPGSLQWPRCPSVAGSYPQLFYIHKSLLSHEVIVYPLFCPSFKASFGVFWCKTYTMYFFTCRQGKGLSSHQTDEWNSTYFLISCHYVLPIFSI